VDVVAAVTEAVAVVEDSVAVVVVGAAAGVGAGAAEVVVAWGEETAVVETDLMYLNLFFSSLFNPRLYTFNSVSDLK